jgi:hypothetical protein
VILDGVSGGVDVYNQNGSIEVSGLAARTPGSLGCNPITLRTSFSPIRVYLPEAAGFNVTARTSFGKINSELPLTVSGSLSADALSGKIGAGECELNLTNNNGNIEILRASLKKK